MDSLTVEQCQRFMFDMTINPITGRKITSHAKGGVKDKLIKQCERVVIGSPSAPPPEAPPMGPVVFPHYRTYKQTGRFHAEANLASNAAKMVAFFENRLPAITGQMEADDIAKQARMYSNEVKDAALVAKLKQVSLAITKLKKAGLIDDYPSTVPSIHGRKIGRDRFDVRHTVYAIYDTIAKNMLLMNHALEHPDTAKWYAFTGMEESLRADRDYVMYVISKGFLMASDVWRMVFVEHGEATFAEAARLLAKYNARAAQLHRAGAS